MLFLCIIIINIIIIIIITIIFFLFFEKTALYFYVNISKVCIISMAAKPVWQGRLKKGSK